MTHKLQDSFVLTAEVLGVLYNNANYPNPSCGFNYFLNLPFTIIVMTFNFL
jgi:hypothetical protein